MIGSNLYAGDAWGKVKNLFKPKVLTEMPGYLQAYRSWYCRNSFSLYFKSAIKPNIKLMNIEELFLHPWLWSVFPLIFFIFSIFESCPVFIPVLSYSHWHCILFPVVLQKFFKTFRHARLTDQTAGLNPEKSWSLFVQIFYPGYGQSLVNASSENAEIGCEPQYFTSICRI